MRIKSDYASKSWLLSFADLMLGKRERAVRRSQANLQKFYATLSKAVRYQVMP